MHILCGNNSPVDDDVVSVHESKSCIDGDVVMTCPHSVTGGYQRSRFPLVVLTVPWWHTGQIKSVRPTVRIPYINFIGVVLLGEDQFCLLWRCLFVECPDQSVVDAADDGVVERPSEGCERRVGGCWDGGVGDRITVDSLTYDGYVLVAGSHPNWASSKSTIGKDRFIFSYSLREFKFKLEI